MGPEDNQSLTPDQDNGSPMSEQIPGTNGATPTTVASARPPMQPRQNPMAAAKVKTAIADVTHHSMLGKAFSTILGDGGTQYTVDPKTGQTVAQPKPPMKPGQLFRGILAGALLGGAMGGAEGKKGDFFSGMGQGAMGVAGQKQQADQNARKNAQQDFENQRQIDKDNEQRKMQDAMIAYHNAQTVREQQLTNIQNEEWHVKRNEKAQAMLGTLEKAGGQPANIQLANGESSNGKPIDASALMETYMKDKSILQPADPEHFVRKFVSLTDMSEVEAVGGQHDGVRWVDKSGNALDMTSKTKIVPIDVPRDFFKEARPYTEKEINDIAHDPHLIPNASASKTRMLTGEEYLTLAARGQKLAEGDAKTKKELSSIDLANKHMKLQIAKAGFEFQRMRREASKEDQSENKQKLQAVVNVIRERSDSLKAQLKASEGNFDAKGVERITNELNANDKQLKKLTEQITGVSFGEAESAEPTPTKAPQPPKKGAMLTPDVARQFMQMSGGDKAKARQAAIAAGWAIPGATPASSNNEEENSPNNPVPSYQD